MILTRVFLQESEVDSTRLRSDALRIGTHSARRKGRVEEAEAEMYVPLYLWPVTNTYLTVLHPCKR